MSTINSDEHEGDDTTIPSKVIQPNYTKELESRAYALETLIKEISGKIILKENKNLPEIEKNDTPDQIRTGVAGSKVLHD
jgi:hypothetical protein